MMTAVDRKNFFRAAIVGLVAFVALGVVAVVLWSPYLKPAEVIPTTSPAPALTGGMDIDFKKTPDWAQPVAVSKVMWQTTKSGMTVTAMDAGADTATKVSGFSNDADDKPMVEVGDPIQYINVVFTNTSDKTIYIDRLGAILWASTAGYQQSLTSVVTIDRVQMEKHGIYPDMVIPGKTAPGFGRRLDPGESCAVGHAVPLNYGKDFEFLPKAAVYPDEKALKGQTPILFDEIMRYTFA